MVQLIFALAVVIAVLSGNGDWSRGLPRAVLVIVGFLFFLAVRSAFNAKDQIQYRRNSAAGRIINTASGRFVLVLRSFELRPPDIEPPKVGAFGVSFGQNTESDEIFSWIDKSSRAALPKSEVVALAGEGNFFGPGQAEVKDEEWKRRVSELCVKAQVIIFMGGATHGAWWELNFLDQYGMFDKTVFVLPPLVWFVGVCPSAGQAAAEFNASLAQYNRIGLPTAKIDDRGAFFTVDNERRLLSFNRIDWTLNSKARLTRELRRISETFHERPLTKLRGPWAPASLPPV